MGGSNELPEPPLHPLLVRVVKVTEAEPTTMQLKTRNQSYIT